MKSPANKQKQATGSSTAATPQQAGQPANPVEMLKADHRKVEGLFAQFEKAGDDNTKRQLVQQICSELIVHTLLEEELFYPFCREQADDEDPLDEAQVEHDGAKVLIQDLMNGEPGSDFYDAKVKVLKEYIRHHVGEEEKPGDGIFATIQKKGQDMNALAQKLQARQQELKQEAGAQRLDPPVPKSLDIQNLTAKEGHQMARYPNDRDRDEYGRFTSDDDRGGPRRYRDDDRYESRGRGSRDEDYDNRGGGGGRGRGGWFGDSEGHSEASRRGWDEREGGNYRSSSRYDDDDRRYSRRDDDDYDRRGNSGGGGGGRGQGGWFGDSEGHSQASREGWDNRGRGGGSRSSSRYDDDDDRRGGNRGGGGGSSSEGRGWFGDPRGHAEAAREGWEHRGRGGSSRSSSRDDVDDRRSSRGGGGGGGGGRNQGGWFGDPEGHSEASRRGWRNRD
jgi:hemerythrin superfamily protein